MLVIRRNTTTANAYAACGILVLDGQGRQQLHSSVRLPRTRIGSCTLHLASARRIHQCTRSPVQHQIASSKLIILLLSIFLDQWESGLRETAACRSGALVPFVGRRFTMSRLVECFDLAFTAWLRKEYDALSLALLAFPRLRSSSSTNRNPGSPIRASNVHTLPPGLIHHNSTALLAPHRATTRR